MENRAQTLNQIHDLLRRYQINPDVLGMYDEPHRYYHTLDHILKMWNSMMDHRWESDQLGLAIVFHDIIYDPKRKDNEWRSYMTLASHPRFHLLENFQQHIISQAACAILSTREHDPKTDLEVKLCQLDLEPLYEGMETLMKNESLIAKEYQYLPYEKYIAGRIEWMKKFIDRVESTIKCTARTHYLFEDYLSYLKSKKPNIGLYAGSFDPFHKGHLNILKKAEKIFDKVIILYGKNPIKTTEERIVPDELSYRQVDFSEGLLTEYVNSLPYDVTLIRGLRNTTDLAQELTQYRFMREAKPDLKVVSIFCDVEFEHISSSNIKQLEKFTDVSNYLVK